MDELQEHICSCCFFNTWFILEIYSYKFCLINWFGQMFVWIDCTGSSSLFLWDVLVIQRCYKEQFLGTASFWSTLLVECFPLLKSRALRTLVWPILDLVSCILFFIVSENRSYFGKNVTHFCLISTIYRRKRWNILFS